MADSMLIPCPKCGATNRVASERARQGEAVCGRCKTPLSLSVAPVIATDANFAATVEGSPLPVLLDLWAAWCGPCRMIAPVIEQLAQELAGRVRVAKLNIDENPMTAARYNVQSIPTLLVLRDGQEIGRIVGALPKAEIVRRLQSVLG
ncbi:MAG TPA: thioredoxin [Blastocatellia bacterium]|nr:thioredoxin [Blastocatellia bacterium]